MTGVGADGLAGCSKAGTIAMHQSGRFNRKELEPVKDDAMRLPARTLALIAHDGKKDEMIRLVDAHREELAHFDLVATGTTGERITAATGLDLKRMRSGPYGGDAQIAALITEGNVVGVVFLVDPLYAHPHEPDIQGLLRICNVYDVPVATNPAAARLLICCLAGSQGDED